MTVMFTDIHEIISRTHINGKMDGQTFTNILYADDTLIVRKRTRETNIILREIETESKYYNTNLNKDKCEVIAMNNDNTIKSSDGTPSKHVGEATYLGGKLTKDTNPITETQNRIAACIPMMKTLDTCWKRTNCKLTWKSTFSTQ